MKGIYLVLGSNLGEKLSSLKYAEKRISESIGGIINRSFYYETEPWGYYQQPVFLNQAIQIETELDPYQLLIQLNSIEKEMGRVRYIKWHERVIDIDILYYHDLVIKSEMLTIPHPEIPNRLFVLAPLNDIAADELHPESGKTQRELLLACKDNLNVKRLD